MKTYINIIKEADSHTKMVTNSFKKGKFDNKFLLSLATISFEKYMVGFLISRENMPKGHTLSFLVKEVCEYTDIPEPDVKLLKDLDDRIQLCSIENKPPYKPDDTKMESIIDTLSRMQKIIKQEIPLSEMKL
jgi:HEPN domain-containing protein